MQVEDGLAGLTVAVDDGTVAHVGEALLPGDIPRREIESAHQVDMAVVQVVQGGDVLPGYHQDVYRGLRVDIIEGHHRIVLVDDLARYLAGSDSAERTVVHDKALFG